MSRSISLFSGYDQKENRTTNYCLLVLKMVCEENSKFLSEWLSNIVGEAFGGHVGVAFTQQARKKSSVPDGVIRQKPLTVYIETKNYDWFYDDQLERHLDALNDEAPGLKVLIALGNFESSDHSKFDSIKALCKEKYQDEIVFVAAGFEDFIQALPTDQLPKNLYDIVQEFREYLDEHNLLPTWRTRLDVVNCAGSFEDVVASRTYMCPATGGAYAHRRSRYLGFYRNKTIEYVAEVRAVVELESSAISRLKWKNVEDDMDNLISEAVKEHCHRTPGDYPMLVFLLGEPQKTAFIKDTKGGMYGSRKYFDIESLGASGADDLARILSGRTWSDYNAASPVSKGGSDGAK